MQSSFSHQVWMKASARNPKRPSPSSTVFCEPSPQASYHQSPHSSHLNFSPRPFFYLHSTTSSSLCLLRLFFLTVFASEIGLARSSRCFLRLMSRFLRFFVLKAKKYRTFGRDRRHFHAISSNSYPLSHHFARFLPEYFSLSIALECLRYHRK